MTHATQYRERLTSRQREVFLLIYASARDRGFQPSTRDLCDALSVTINAVSGFLQGLQNKGWIERGDGHSRAVKLLKRPDGTAFDGFLDK